MKKQAKNKQSKIKEILYELLNGKFFDGKGKTTLDVVKRLTQRGFTIKGKKIGMVARMLTQMCQDSTTGLERDEIPREKRQRGEKWIFKKIKKRK
jgi:formylmethanofuran dehydrogenase subunit E